MANAYEKSLFSRLSNEILIEIVNRLDAGSLFVFCDLYHLDYFLQEKRVIERLDLQRLYFFDFKIAFQKIRCELVKSLNINNVYWICASKLRTYIGSLKNLQELYAIGTELTITESDIDLYNRLQIRVLGISVRTNDHEFLSVPSVRSLYLQLFEQFDIRAFFPSLQKIWLDFENNKYIIYEEKYFRKIEKFYFQSKRCSLVTSVKGAYYKNYISTDWGFGLYPYYITCKDVFPLREINIGADVPVWNIFKDLVIPFPFGPRDSWKLHHNDTLQTIKFCELLLSHKNHKKTSCINELSEAYRKILGLECSSRLKRLYVKSCVLRDEGLQPVRQPSTSTSNKRLAIASPTIPDDLNAIFTNLQPLQVFELSMCHKPSHRVCSAFSLIQTLKNLKHLSLEVPLFVREGFLEAIFKNCTGLEVVKLRPNQPNERLNFEVSAAIRFAYNLKDFFYENQNIPVEKLLGRLPSGKIQRLALVCKETSPINPVILKLFLEKNRQLIFLYLAVEHLKNETIRALQLILRSYRDANQAKVFIVKKTVETSYVPFVHLYDVIYNQIFTLKLQACDEFENF